MGLTPSVDKNRLRLDVVRQKRREPRTKGATENAVPGSHLKVLGPDSREVLANYAEVRILVIVEQNTIPVFAPLDHFKGFPDTYPDEARTQPRVIFVDEEHKEVEVLDGGASNLQCHPFWNHYPFTVLPVEVGSGVRREEFHVLESRIEFIHVAVLLVLGYVKNELVRIPLLSLGSEHLHADSPLIWPVNDILFGNDILGSAIP